MSGYLGTDDFGDVDHMMYDGENIFTEKLRRRSNEAINTGTRPLDLVFALNALHTQLIPCHQATYFLKQMEILPPHLPTELRASINI